MFACRVPIPRGLVSIECGPHRETLPYSRWTPLPAHVHRHLTVPESATALHAGYSIGRRGVSRNPIGGRKTKLVWSFAIVLGNSGLRRSSAALREGEYPILDADAIPAVPLGHTPHQRAGRSAFTSPARAAVRRLRDRTLPTTRRRCDAGRCQLR
jgi:hypothetical protein